MKDIDTTSIDAAWPDAGEPTPTKLPPEVLEILCAPLIAIVRGRKARGSTVPSREEMTKRTFIRKVFDRLNISKAEGCGWKISYVPTRFKMI